VVNVGILGAGFMGKMHAECYYNLANAKLVAVGDVDREKAGELAKNHNAHALSQPEKVIENEDIDLIDVCLPTFLHKEYVIKAAQAGKHVLCEKPIALTVQDAEEMIRVAEIAKVKFMIAQVIRFWPEYIMLKQTYENKRLGRILSINLSRLSAAPTWSWRDWMLDSAKSGSALVDLHIHDTDYLLCLLGKPSFVFTQGSKSDIGYGHIFTTFTFPNGVVAFAEAGWDIMIDNFPFVVAFRAIFEKGVVDFNSGRERTLSVYEQGKEVRYPAVQGELLSSKDVRGNISQMGPYFSEIKYFVNCIEDDQLPLMAEANSAKDSLKIVLAEKRSAETGEVIRFDNQ